MNRKELTKTFMMILNWKKNNFDCDVFYKLIQRFRVKLTKADVSQN